MTGSFIIPNSLLEAIAFSSYKSLFWSKSQLKRDEYFFPNKKISPSSTWIAVVILFSNLLVDARKKEKSL